MTIMSLLTFLAYENIYTYLEAFGTKWIISTLKRIQEIMLKDQSL